MRALTLLLLVMVIGPAGTLSAQEGGPAGEATVSMDHFAFEPEELTVTVGTTVSWTYDAEADDPQPNCESPQFRANDSCPGHSTTASDEGSDGQPLWDSGVHRADGFPFSHTFTEPGRYAYFCTVHGGGSPNNPATAMNGVIVVTAAEEEEAPEQAPEADATEPPPAAEAAPEQTPDDAGPGGSTAPDGGGAEGPAEQAGPEVPGYADPQATLPVSGPLAGTGLLGLALLGSAMAVHTVRRRVT